MAKILGNFHFALLIGIVLLLAAMFGLHGGLIGDGGYDWTQFMRYLHIFAGILWIGLLYYFNFVQIPTMPSVPAELKPAVSKYIAPEALFWFRWAALFTVLMGLIVAYTRGVDYAHEALTLGLYNGYAVSDQGFTLLGLGMWLAIIMFINVWVFIWPNQKIALGIVDADADAKAKAGRTAMLFSRTNLLLSIPMLTTMTMNQTLFG